MGFSGGTTRRQVLKGAVCTAGLLMAGPGRRVMAGSRQSESGPAQTERLTDTLFIIRMPGEANVLARTGRDGLILVDGASAAGSPTLLKTVATLPGAGPVQTLFNTHWHPEQTGSNETVGSAGAAIIAHENTRLWLTTEVSWSWNGREFKPLPKIAQPNRTFYTDGTLGPGVRYGYIPDAAHTDGDMYVHFTDENVLAVGDVVSGQGWPTVDWATGGWIGGMVGGLQRLATLADASTRIVPGRGPVLSLEDLKTQLQMYATIYERLTGLLNKGRSPGEAVEARPTKEFDAQMGNPDEFVRRSFESLWAYLSPDA